MTNVAVFCAPHLLILGVFVSLSLPGESTAETLSASVYNLAFPAEYACSGVASSDPQGFRLKCRLNPPRSMACACFERGGPLAQRLSCSCDTPLNGTRASRPLVGRLGQVHAGPGLREPT